MIATSQFPSPSPQGTGQGWGEDTSVMANEIARSLRKRQTIAESRLWDDLRELRRQGYHFRRQAPINGFIVDFACLSHRLVIEVEGAQHEDVEHKARDRNRDSQLGLHGFNVIRCANADVMENRDGVILEILAALGAVVRHD